jgi:hypothetical protein
VTGGGAAAACCCGFSPQDASATASSTTNGRQLLMDATLFLIRFKDPEGFVAFKEISHARAAPIAAASKMRPDHAAFKPRRWSRRSSIYRVCGANFYPASDDGTINGSATLPEWAGDDFAKLEPHFAERVPHARCRSSAN